MSRKQQYNIGNQRFRDTFPDTLKKKKEKTIKLWGSIVNLTPEERAKVIKIAGHDEETVKVPFSQIVSKILPELERLCKEYLKEEILSNNPFPIDGMGFLEYLKQKYVKEKRKNN